MISKDFVMAESNDIDEEIKSLIGYDLQKEVADQLSRVSSLPLEQRNDGAYGRAESALGLPPNGFVRRQLLKLSAGFAANKVAIATGAMGNVGAALILSGYHAIADNDSEWIVSKELTNAVLLGDYSKIDFGAADRNSGDQAIIDSMTYHRYSNFQLLQDNIARLIKASKNNDDPNARVAINARIVIDYNLLGFGKESKAALDKLLGVDFKSPEISHHAILRAMDFGSTVALNCADASALSSLSVEEYSDCFKLYRSSPFYSEQGIFFDHVPDFGLKIWTLLQAHYIEKIRTSAPHSRSQLRDEYIESILLHLSKAKDMNYPDMTGLCEDAIYAMTRMGYSAILDGNLQQARRIADISVRDNEKLDRLGGREAKDTINRMRYGQNSQWMRLLDVRLDLADNDQWLATRKLEHLQERRVKGPAGRTGNIALERAFDEMVRFAAGTRHYDTFLEIPGLQLSTGYVSALTI